MSLSLLRRSGLVAASISLCFAVTLGMAPATAQSPAAGRLSAIELLDPAWTFGKAAVSLGIVYTTTDQHGAPAQASGALYLPPGLPPQGGWPLVVWAHGTAGIGDGCAPSRRPQSERNSTYFDRILENGYAVLAPDYQGLGTGGQFSYYNANVEGMSILDAVAALRTTPVPLSREWVVVGQSEGAHAAMSAAGLYTEKGSSAEGLSGVVATGLRTDPSKSLPQMIRPDSTGSKNQIAYTAYYLASLEELKPGSVLPYLSDFGKEYVEKAATECLSNLVARAEGRRPAALFADPDRPTPTFAADIAALAGYPEDRFTSDLMIGYGTADIDVPPTGTEDYGKTLQGLNTEIRVTVRQYPGKDHSGAFLASLPDALAFLNTHLR
ncbi:alpha/beta hydrolase family protein [Nocardia niwae]|uniref:Lipase family protein n=1 Tax=Nocardia niwae TaxID=626084 RepID=A0ABV2X4I0_9NOCA|nr:alpha/beta hydrolase [Nocardia niwae]